MKEIETIRGMQLAVGMWHSHTFGDVDLAKVKAKFAEEAGEFLAAATEEEEGEEIADIFVVLFAYACRRNIMVTTVLNEKFEKILRSDRNAVQRDMERGL